MELVRRKAYYKKIYVYLDTEYGDYSSLKILSLVSRYPKDVCGAGVIIAFYLNSVGRGFDFRQKSHKIVQIVLWISAWERLEDPIKSSRKHLEDKKRCWESKK